MVDAPAFWVQGHPLEEVKPASPPFKCLENGRVEDCTGQPNTGRGWGESTVLWGHSHQFFLVPSLIQLILEQFCRCAPPGRGQMPLGHGDSGIASLSPLVNQSNGSFCPHSILPACRGRTPMLQSFTLGEGDSAHLYNRQNTQTGVLDRLFGVPHTGWGCRTSSLHGLGAENPEAVHAQAKPGRQTPTSTSW